MALETCTNLAVTTLNGAINNSVTSITVTSGAVFPSTGNFRILIGSEIMLVTARSTNVLTVTRAQESTSAASHSDLDVVSGPLTALAVDKFVGDLAQSGTFASTPAATKDGLLYFPTDSDLWTRDNGSSLMSLSSMNQFTAPVLSDFTWLNQGSCTTSTTKGGINVQIPADSGLSLRVLHKSKTAPYKITGFFILNQNSLSYESCGMGFYDPTGGKLVSMHFIVFDYDFSYVEVCRWGSTTVFNSAPAYSYMATCGYTMGWMQIEYDSTNLYFRMSNNGFDWITVYSEGKTAWLANAPTKAMFYGRNNTNNVINHAFTLLSWKEE